MAGEFQIIQDFNSQMEHIPARSVVSRRLISNDRVKITLLGFAPEQKLAEPAPDGAAVLEVRRGNGVVFLEDDVYDIQPGSLIYINSPIPYRLEARSEMVVLITELKPDKDG